MMKIGKEKVFTLFALTLLIVAMVTVSLNVPTSALYVPPPQNLHGPSLAPVHMHGPPLTPIHMNSNKTLTPVHMHYLRGILDPSIPPIGTEWHELYPQFCQSWNLTSWIDMQPPETPGWMELSPNDQIDMTNATGDISWYHVDRMTWTMQLFSEDLVEKIYVEYKGPYEKIYNPTSTLWHEVWPSYSKIYHIIGWMDNPYGQPNGYLDFCDYVELASFPGIWWHVEEYATDIILREKIMNPKCTWWHEIYPQYCNWYHLTSWMDHGLPAGQLSPSDQIDMTDESGIVTWYHVDRVTVAINVTLGTGEWMKLELKTRKFEDMYEAFKSPVGTLWHEVYPTYSNVYALTWWDPMNPEFDNCNGVLDPCDFIVLTNMTGGVPGTELYCHIEDMCYDIILNKKIMNPVCTDWIEVYPEYDPPELVKRFHLNSWEDADRDGRLSPYDQIDMVDIKTEELSWWHVDRVTLTLNITIVGQPGFYYLFEYKGPFKDMYRVKTEPICTYWHEVWPYYGELESFHLEDWIDNCNGVLDRCDRILLAGVWCHVEGLFIDIILNKKIMNPVCTDWLELYPYFGWWYHLEGWEDTQPEGDPGHGMLSPCDNVNLTLQPGGPTFEMHVKNVTLTINITYAGDSLFYEYTGPFETMYRVKTNPIYTDWVQVWPFYGYPARIDDWADNCNGVLDRCDYIQIEGVWFHVEEVAIDIVVEPLPVHDVAVIDVVSLLPWVYQGEVDPINVTVENQGNQIETVDVYAFYDGNLAAPKQITILNPGQIVSLIFNWNTMGVLPGFYTVSANATITTAGVTDDDPSDNIATGNIQEVKLQPPFYWKEPFKDYAPSGMPDFDERQWGTYNWSNLGTWSHCAPVAAANSLWWYDSAYDPCPLVTAYGPWDDHSTQNVQPFVEHLAFLMDTDGRRTGPVTGIFHLGTKVMDMETGITQYLSWSGVNPLGDCNGDGIVNQTDVNIVNNAMGTMPGVPGWDMRADIFPATVSYPPVADNIVDPNDLNLVLANLGRTGMFYEHTMRAPDFYFIEEEVERCQDVVLLLGFYIETGPGEYYREDYPYPYGHAVTVAGVNSITMQIAISDPVIDAFELGLAPGRSPVPHMHMPPEPPYILHNNASLVSHDIYKVTFNPVLGMWELVNYAGYPTPPWHVLIENAVITSPLEEEVCGIDITNVVPSFKGQVINAAYRKWTILVNVTVHNNGTVTTNCTVNAYYSNATGTYLIGTQAVTNLPPCNTTTLTFDWSIASLTTNTTYTVKANATCPCGVSDEFIDGLVFVRLWGDVDGNGAINILDLKRVKLAYSGLIVEPFADLDGNCAVNILDVKLMKLIYSGLLSPWDP